VIKILLYTPVETRPDIAAWARACDAKVNEQKHADPSVKRYQEKLEAALKFARINGRFPD
jgi:hypothetical protein